MSEPVLFDTTAHIQAFRTRSLLPSMFDLEGEFMVHLSSVVAEELYIGASTTDMRRSVNRLWFFAQEMDRLITPNADHWREAGLVLQQVAARYGSARVAAGRMTNDALIALSARDSKLVILTTNIKDFGLLREFLPFAFRPFNLS